MTDTISKIETIVVRRIDCKTIIVDEANTVDSVTRIDRLTAAFSMSYNQVDHH